MIWTRCLTVIIASQLSLSITAQSNITQDAVDSLRHFRFQIQETERLVSITSADVWDMAINENVNVLIAHVLDDTENFNILKSSITPFADDVINATECLDVLDITLELDKYVINASIEENEVFLGLHSLAKEEIGYYKNLSIDLQAQFDRNCVKELINCDALSASIVAEVERLLPLAIRISYAIMSETYILSYKMALRVELLQSQIISEYKEAVQNATVCLASRIKYTKNSSETSVNEEEPIWKAFLNLQRVVDLSFLENLSDLLFNMTDSMIRCQNTYLTTNTSIRNAVSRANQTINKLIDTAHNLQVDAVCPLPDLQYFINSSLSRALEEYRLYINVTRSKYTDGDSQIKSITEELNSIGLEVAGCSTENVTCEYLSEKISRKSQEMPELIKKSANAKSVVMYQSVGAVWESGAHVVRDVLEQLEVRIVNLKSCLQLSLY